MFGRKRLLREIAFLRSELDWYASAHNWRKTMISAKGEPKQFAKSPAAFDRGARAKFILSQLTPIEHRSFRQALRRAALRMFGPATHEITPTVPAPRPRANRMPRALKSQDQA